MNSKIEEIVKQNNGLTVITGPNGSGKTRLLKEIAEKYGCKCVLLDADSHCNLNKTALEKFGSDLKEQAKTQNIVVVSVRQDIIDIADRVITL